MEQLNVVNIKATDLQDAWFQCLASVVENGYAYEVTEGSYAKTEDQAGQMRFEFDFATIQITHPWTEPLLPQIPQGLGIPDPVPGGMDYIHEYLSTYLMDGIIKPKETYTYGSRLVGPKYDISDPGWKDVAQINPISFEKNQIQTVIDTFKRSHGTNQATMEIGMPSDCGTTDPPCLRLIDCRVRYGALHFMVYFRSWDLWSGFPANLAGLELLKQYMASEIGVENGEIIACSKGLHIYSYAEDLAKIRLGIEEFNVRCEDGKNKYGCIPFEDVCLEHDEPLVCEHGCGEAEYHMCDERLDQGLPTSLDPLGYEDEYSGSKR